MNLFKSRQRTSHTDNPDQAFTRLDLLVLILVFCGLAVLSRPVWGGSQAKSHSALCLSNFKRIVGAWQLYTEDHAGRLVMMVHGAQAQGGAAGNNPANAPWALGWLDWTTAPDNTNTAFLTQDKYAKLAVYLQRSTDVFKCPADQYLSSSQKARGWKERVRTISGNIGVGGRDAKSGPFDPLYKVILTTSGFLYPGPAETWVFLEEHPDSMNDPAFFSPRASAWIDMPGLFHGNGTTFAFADGRVETHAWEASLTAPAVRNVRISSYFSPPVKAGDADIHWMSYHGGRVSETSY